MKQPAPIRSVAAARERAQRRLPKVVFDMVQAGTGASALVTRNEAAFDAVTLWPRAATRPSPRTLTTSVLGREIGLPVILAPVGRARLVHPDGEVAAARAAEQARTAIAVSTMAGFPVEAVTAAASNVWYQLYFVGGRAGAELAIDRAQTAGCSALVLTVDMATGAGRDQTWRVRDLPPRFGWRETLQYGPRLLGSPGWLAGFVRLGGSLPVPNAQGGAGQPPFPAETAFASSRQHPPAWDDLRWLRDRWDGPLVVKGILRPDDARRAVDLGADAVVVSNHGGNAFDAAPTSVEALPAVVAAVGDTTEVLLDSGVRRGLDVVRGVALGARAVLIGRAYLWGLAAGGEAGVNQVLAALAAEIDHSLAILGCASIEDVDESVLTCRMP